MIETGLVLQTMKAESQKPVLATVWVAKHVDQNYAPRPKANVVLNFWEILQQGAIVQVHTQNVFENNLTHLSTLKRLYTDAQELMPYLVNAQVLAYAAILDWADPCGLCGCRLK